MTVFVDASALVAMISGEPDGPDLASSLVRDQGRITSGMAVWETVRAVARQPKNGLDLAFAEVKRFFAVMQIAVVPIGEAEAAEAVRAHARYGKGTGHRARLNMGDCFAYACAKTNGARLLYKGDDFIHTDLG